MGAASELTSEPLTESIERLSGIVETIAAFSAQCQADAANARTERKFLMDFMAGALELANDLQNHDSALVARLKFLGKKTELRASVDYWFWRPETNGMTHRNQLRKRAGYLKATGFTVDQAWDLLSDFVAGWTIEEIDEILLKSVLAEAYKKHARAA
jgi:hypothetical protein